MTNDRFRRALKLELTDRRGSPLFETINELKNLMRLKEFRMKKEKKTGILHPVDPTQKQLNYAFKFLKGFAQMEITDFGILFRDKRNIQHRRDPITGRFMKLRV